MMLFASVFSVATGVGGCECPIYARSIHMDVAFWQFSKNPPNYASVDDSMTFLMILHYTYTEPFSVVIDVIGVLDFVLRKNPSAMLRASGSDMQDASEDIWSIILLLLHYITEYGCDAL